MTLKTLKDFEKIEVIRIYDEKLRQEAIKWIKEETLVCLDCNKIEEDKTCLNHNVIEMSGEVKEWIKHFFNIKESDLK